MTLFGYDISHHQGDFDHALAADQGMAFAMVKATEGRGFRDPKWPQNRTRLKAAEIPFAAYHFMWGSSIGGNLPGEFFWAPAAEPVPIEQQAQNIAEYIGDKDIPVMVDTEIRRVSDFGVLSRPTVADVRKFIAECTARNVRCSLHYLPEWYWEGFLNSPDLSNLPPIVQSHYVDPEVPPAPPAQMYPGDSNSRWQYAGGNKPVILQFTDRARIAGQTPVDANAFRGDRADLAEWFYTPEGSTMADLNLNQVVIPAADGKPAVTMGQILRRIPAFADRAELFYTSEKGRDDAEAERDQQDRDAALAAASAAAARDAETWAKGEFNRDVIISEIREAVQSTHMTADEVVDLMAARLGNG